MKGALVRKMGSTTRVYGIRTVYMYMIALSSTKVLLIGVANQRAHFVASFISSARRYCIFCTFWPLDMMPSLKIKGSESSMSSQDSRIQLPSPPIHPKPFPLGQCHSPDLHLPSSSTFLSRSIIRFWKWLRCFHWRRFH